MINFITLPLYSREELLWGPRGGLDFSEKREIFGFYRKLNTNLSLIQPGSYSLCDIKGD